MHTVHKKIKYEGKLQNFKLSAPLGGAMEYHVYIENFYQGSMFLRNGVWVGFMNDKCKLTEEQIAKLSVIIEQDENYGKI